MKVVKILLCIFGVVVSVLVVLLFVVGAQSPDTYIYVGNQIPSKYIEEAKSLGLIEDGEVVKYFYSDAIFDVKKGMYIVTDKHVILYSSEWQVPKAIVSLSDISDIQAVFDDSFMTDSVVFISDVNGGEYAMPLSSEQGRDVKVVNYLQKFVPEKDSELTEDEI